MKIRSTNTTELDIRETTHDIEIALFISWDTIIGRHPMARSRFARFVGHNVCTISLEDGCIESVR